MHAAILEGLDETGITIMRMDEGLDTGDMISKVSCDIRGKDIIEVSRILADAGAKLLREDGVKVRLVSVPSEGLFRSQSKEYQQSVLPDGKRKFGLTAGLPVTLEGLVGNDGAIWGLESFGFSAPYKVLDEKLGYTAQNVYNQVKEFLK